MHPHDQLLDRLAAEVFKLNASSDRGRRLAQRRHDLLLCCQRAASIAGPGDAVHFSVFSRGKR